MITVRVSSGEAIPNITEKERQLVLCENPPRLPHVSFRSRRVSALLESTTAYSSTANGVLHCLADRGAKTWCSGGYDDARTPLRRSRARIISVRRSALTEMAQDALAGKRKIGLLIFVHIPKECGDPGLCRGDRVDQRQGG